MRLNKRIVAAFGAVVLLGLAALGSTAFAAAPRQTTTPGAPTTSSPRPVKIEGRVQSVSGSGLVLKAGPRTVSVNANASTWIVLRESGRCAEAQLNQVQTGKPALVEGLTTTITNTLDARVITQGNCPAAAAARALRRVRQGTVKSISGQTLVLTTAAGRDVTVNTIAQTVVLNNGFNRVSSIKVGDKVQVFGRPQAAARAGQTGAAAPTIEAYAIHDLAANTRVTLGHVSAVRGNTITLGGSKNGTGRAVNVDSSTGFKTLSLSNGAFTLSDAALTDVKVGSNLLLEVSGTSGSSGVTARAVIILAGATGSTTNP